MTDDRLKIWLSFLKFLLGAGGIGLVSTIINWQIQQQQSQIDLRNAELQYLERFVAGALHDDLYKRRNYAQYFATVTISKESRSRWKEYLVIVNDEIVESLDSIRTKSLKLAEKTKKTSAEEDNLDILKKRLALAKESGDKTAPIKELVKELALSKEKLAALVQDLQTGRGELNRLKSEITSLDSPTVRGIHAISKVFIGTWQGEGLQENSGESWDIKISIDQDSASIEYPSLSCGGVLKPISRPNLTQARFRENILFGINQCVNYGSVVLSVINDKELRFNWYYPSGKIGAKGRLNKK